MLSFDITDEEKDALREEVICGNLRFVISVCKEYQNQGLDFSDLIAEGNYGLIKAFENFNWSRNIRFISYAKWWVMQSILEGINKNSRTIRLPVNIIQEYYKFKKTISKLDPSLLDDLPPLLKSIGLENSAGENSGNVFEMVQDSGDDFAEVDRQLKLKEKLMGILSKLNNRDKYIIENYYGIGVEPKKLDEIGEFLNLTKERVRQIKENTIRKLRNETIELFDFI